jgi:iron-sulfur cluster repair protein YtfE (RIC family)
MKRHQSLAHLSRDHHPALILAQLLKRNAPAYKGLPTDTAGKLNYAEKFYNEELVTHFAQEEKMMDMLAGLNLELDEKIKQIKAEHIILHNLFTGISKQIDSVTAMDELGTQLDQHIRKEERELFPLIEKSCDEPMMDSIEKLLTS